MPLTYWLETYGCQMNFAESNAIELDFAKAGIIPASAPEEADIAVLNTCSVRQTAENRIWGRLGFYQHMKSERKLTVILTGCMAERLADDIKKRAPAVDYVVGTNEKQHLLEIIQNHPEVHEEYDFMTSYKGKHPSKSLLPIMNGCNNFCAYCIVPYVRGREVSRNPDEIIAEIDELQRLDVKEITLLGQNVNSYSYELNDRIVTFPELLKRITASVSDQVWIRFLSPHPKDFSQELISLIGDEKKICSHVHLPVQSGSDTVLQAMKRGYTRESYLELVASLRAADSAVTFSTDILVGFPGETEKDFEDTIDLVERVGYLDAYMYYFNPREGTEAMQMGGHLADEIKLSRLQKLIDFQRSKALEIKQSRIGRIERVLCENYSRKDPNKLLGRTEHDEIVLIEDTNLTTGSFVDVTISGLTGTTYKGETLCPGKPS
jgi:tRNA-2-methylthio-N6-dimethylallyladenosine synthase